MTKKQKAARAFTASVDTATEMADGMAEIAKRVAELASVTRVGSVLRQTTVAVVSEDADIEADMVTLFAPLPEQAGETIMIAGVGTLDFRLAELTAEPVYTDDGDLVVSVRPKGEPGVEPVAMRFVNAAWLRGVKQVDDDDLGITPEGKADVIPFPQGGSDTVH